MRTVSARRVFGAVVTGVLALSATLGGGVAGAALPAGVTVSGPVTGGLGKPSALTTNFDLGTVGYRQSEFFFSGIASSYTSATPLTSDGRWSVTPATQAPYASRMIVHRPVDPRKFNGTVFVEWTS